VKWREVAELFKRNVFFLAYGEKYSVVICGLIRSAYAQPTMIFVTVCSSYLNDGVEMGCDFPLC
jgi:3'-phosphoadenosine 5'-phosphosulfate sulfotransferase (PAPS reductase)/FAD synthetase